VEFETSPWSLPRFFEPQTYGRRIVAVQIPGERMRTAADYVQFYYASEVLDADDPRPLDRAKARPAVGEFLEWLKNRPPAARPGVDIILTCHLRRLPTVAWSELAPEGPGRR
jgi:hypothetical protein